MYIPILTEIIFNVYIKFQISHGLLRFQCSKIPYKFQ